MSLLYLLLCSIVKLYTQIKELKMFRNNNYMATEMVTLISVLGLVGGVCLTIITIIQ